MKIDILASGSGGNCIAVRSGSTVILVDAGIPKTKIEKRLLEAGIRPDEIACIFVTHAHIDHVKGLPLANKYRIPVYASEGEWKDIKGVDEDLHRTLRPYTELEILDEPRITVRWFRTHHDSYDSLMFTIEAEQKVSICLDTGRVDRDMLKAMEGSDIYIIEANHDPELVAVSEYPDSVKARVLSDLGHLSNQQTAAALAQLVQGRGERVYLTHLSKSNNIPELAQATVEAALRRRGYTNGKDYFLEVV
ncbi:MBL fold metallo-hydrolase [Cohnella lubricantis]|uniref:MBL fold metallo-hydrolase n=1 Tax=Cohnella lubricantis TaxID=2163172 RepID=A0A841TBY2_9BACL|nr:MBL fold metallo-hydrolase [Cohnella lubricantis]MBB6675951.1 MBL fold metallo-hydrolase [Cohnella lubricantis]MBP2117932.1 phosphoribosyl 1,2-cyclic phosphodiesterase [Cohnella lubricantis]